MLCKNCVLKKFPKCTGKHPSDSKRLKLTVKTPEQSQWRILQNFINTPFFKEYLAVSAIAIP